MAFWNKLVKRWDDLVQHNITRFFFGRVNLRVASWVKLVETKDKCDERDRSCFSVKIDQNLAILNRLG